MVRKQSPTLYKNILFTVGIIALVCVVSFIVSYVTLRSNESNAKACEHARDIDDKVCMDKTTYHNLVSHKQGGNSASTSRDIRVLKDPLYPALNRSETDTHNSVVNAIEQKQLYNTSQEFTDRYRMVAYLTNSDNQKDSGGNVWKLMARQKNKNQAEFYLIPANNNYDVKIMLNNDMIEGEKLRDLYTLPNALTFKSPLLNNTPYTVTELPMTDFTNHYT